MKSLPEELGFPIRIVLHIGMTKSGSTSVQNYLERHRAEMAAQGMLFPLTGFSRRDAHDPQRTPAHRDLFQMIEAGETAQFIKECREFYAQAPDREQARIILSAEELFHLPRAVLCPMLAKLITFLGESKLSVVAVVRNQREWLRARYQELVTGGWAIETRAFDFYVRDAMALKLPDYVYWLDSFRMALPDAEIKVLAYEDLVRGGDLVAEVLRTFGVPPDEAPTSEPERSNVSAKIGPGLEAVRRVAAFSAIFDRDLRQLWRQKLIQRYAELLSDTEKKILPKLSRQTETALADHMSQVNAVLSASYLEGRAVPPVDVPEPETGRPSLASGRRIDALAQVALSELEQIAQNNESALQTPALNFPLDIDECRVAARNHAALGEARVIRVHGAVGPALLAAGLSGRHITLSGVDGVEMRTFQSFLDQSDMPSPVIDGNGPQDDDPWSVDWFPEDLPRPDLVVLNGESDAWQELLPSLWTASYHAGVAPPVCLVRIAGELQPAPEYIKRRAGITQPAPSEHPTA